MIKNSAYIRSFLPWQKQQLEEIAATEKLKNANDVFLFTLKQHQEQKQEIARLKRIIEYKQKKNRPTKK